MFGLWIGKLAILVLRLTGRQGTSLPGKVALRVNPRILARLAKHLNECIVVTGTNGKTTTANLLGDILAADGPIIQNRAGSNMIQGLVSTLLLHTTWMGRLRIKRALFEVDEASLPNVAVDLPIRIAVLTNVFRDQLDRYGELDTTVNKLIEGLRGTEAKVIVNADDPLSLHVALESKRPVVPYGFADSLVNLQSPETLGEDDFPRDGAFCMTCGERLEYDVFVYGQLGIYRCKGCGFERPEATYGGHYAGHRIFVNAAGEQDEYVLPVRGLFNAYNVLAAVSAARFLDVSSNSIEQGLARFEPPLGRMQPFETMPPSILNLIKNPTGADNVLQAVISEPGDKVVCIIIHDNAADGRDVSWLWDTRFELLCSPDAHVQSIVTSGLRAEDMALRLKYAGFPAAQVSCQPDLERALEAALQHGHPFPGSTVHVLATYTALAPAAECLKKLEGASHHVEPTLHRASVS